MFNSESQGPSLKIIFCGSKNSIFELWTLEFDKFQKWISEISKSPPKKKKSMSKICLIPGLIHSSKIEFFVSQPLYQMYTVEVTYNRQFFFCAILVRSNFDRRSLKIVIGLHTSPSQQCRLQVTPTVYDGAIREIFVINFPSGVTDVCVLLCRLRFPLTVVVNGKNPVFRIDRTIQQNFGAVVRSGLRSNERGRSGLKGHSLS